jgi:hypothetical protein
MPQWASDNPRRGLGYWCGLRLSLPPSVGIRPLQRLLIETVKLVTAVISNHLLKPQLKQMLVQQLLNIQHLAIRRTKFVVDVAIQEKAAMEYLLMDTRVTNYRVKKGVADSYHSLSPCYFSDVTKLF